jgi:hypothetical protein
MARTKEVKDAISLLETVHLLGESLTFNERQDRIARTLRILNLSLGTKNELHTEIEHNPFDGYCKCDVCMKRRPLTQADIDDTQVKIAAHNALNTKKATR